MILLTRFDMREDLPDGTFESVFNGHGELIDVWRGHMHVTVCKVQTPVDDVEALCSATQKTFDELAGKVAGLLPMTMSFKGVTRYDKFYVTTGTFDNPKAGEWFADLASTFARNVHDVAPSVRVTTSPPHATVRKYGRVELSDEMASVSCAGCTLLCVELTNAGKPYDEDPVLAGEKCRRIFKSLSLKREGEAHAGGDSSGGADGDVDSTDAAASADRK